jgi:acetyl esterase/lipase
MLAESVELAARAQAAGAQVTLSVYPRMWHVFPMYHHAIIAHILICRVYSCTSVITHKIHAMRTGGY